MSTDNGPRFATGLGWGMVATVVMSIPMIAGTAAGFLPMPRPIPAAIVGTIFGQTLPQPVLMVLAAASHLVYGGVAGGILATITQPLTLATGLGWGVLLWAVMGVAWLPFLGWGLFGTGISPRVTVATLVLHLIYGVTLGWLMDRR
ncbi:MAG: hypothetical protein ACOC5J_03575 [Gemmatimonadota bacterium]